MQHAEVVGLQEGVERELPVHAPRQHARGEVMEARESEARDLFADRTSLVLVEVLTTGAGFGAGMLYPVGTVSVQNAVDRAHLGVATGVMTFLRTLGGALGVAALGAIALGYGLPLGHEGASAVRVADTAPFAAIFLAAAALMFACLVAIWLMPEKALRGRDPEAPPVVVE